MKGCTTIPKARTSPLECLVLYPGHTFWGFYLSTEMQSVYSTAPADWAINLNEDQLIYLVDILN